MKKKNPVATVQAAKIAAGNVIKDKVVNGQLTAARFFLLVVTKNKHRRYLRDTTVMRYKLADLPPPSRSPPPPLIASSWTACFVSEYIAGVLTIKKISLKATAAISAKYVEVTADVTG